MNGGGGIQSAGGGGLEASHFAAAENEPSGKPSDEKLKPILRRGTDQGDFRGSFNAIKESFFQAIGKNAGASLGEQVARGIPLSICYSLATVGLAASTLTLFVGFMAGGALGILAGKPVESAEFFGSLASVVVGACIGVPAALVASLCAKEGTRVDTAKDMFFLAAPFTIVLREMFSSAPNEGSSPEIGMEPIKIEGSHEEKAAKRKMNALLDSLLKEKYGKDGNYKTPFKNLSSILKDSSLEFPLAKECLKDIEKGNESGAENKISNFLFDNLRELRTLSPENKQQFLSKFIKPEEEPPGKSEIPAGELTIDSRRGSSPLGSTGKGGPSKSIAAPRQKEQEPKQKLLQMLDDITKEISSSETKSSQPALNAFYLIMSAFSEEFPLAQECLRDIKQGKEESEVKEKIKKFFKENSSQLAGCQDMKGNQQFVDQCIANEIFKKGSLQGDGTTTQELFDLVEQLTMGMEERSDVRTGKSYEKLRIVFKNENFSLNKKYREKIKSDKKFDKQELIKDLMQFQRKKKEQLVGLNLYPGEDGDMYKAFAEKN